MIPSVETYDEAGTVDVEVMQTEVKRLAAMQAAQDAELLAELQERAKAGPGFTRDGEEMTEEDFEALATEAEATVPYRHMNRAERRQAVVDFKANLRALPRAVPVRNPTIRARKHR